MHRIRKIALLSASLTFLNGCIASDINFANKIFPDKWQSQTDQKIDMKEFDALQNWWKNFDDPILNQLVSFTMSQNPDREIIKARIKEARGVRRSTRSLLFPKIDGTAMVNQEDNGFQEGIFYEAGFDLSFELDVFGANRNDLDAADAKIASLQAQYHDVSLTLIAEIIRTYYELREAEKQSLIAQKNVDIQKKTVELVQQLKDVGESPQLDVDRAQALLNTTKASISNFQRLANNARLRMTVLTGEMPQEISNLIQQDSFKIGVLPSIEPVVAVSANILYSRPDIRAAKFQLEEAAALRASAFADLFPKFNISSFFGLAETAFADSTNIWRIGLGTAVSLLDFGRIEGQIDVSKAIEKQAYERYKKTILEAVTEIEIALNDFIQFNDQYAMLNKAYESSLSAYNISQKLYTEGEISFLDLLDSQRTLNQAEFDLVLSEGQRVQSVIRIYKSFGVY